MSDFSPDVSAEPFEALRAWRTLEEEFAAGDVPHCRAVSAPLAWHPALLERLARLTLNVGPDAPSPVREGHPDLVVAGEVGRAPDVAACRALIQDLALKPAASVRRLGVVLSADQLLPPAANSLLKLAEEPPSHACLLFLLEGGVILPTLRSRARFTVLAAPAAAEGAAPPSSDGEWLAWVEGARGGDVPVVAALASWATWALRRGDAPQAAKLDRLRTIAETKNLSVPMLCDLLILALREELPFEHLFGNFR